MQPDRKIGFNIREIGTKVKDFLLEPITFSRELRLRSNGVFMPGEMAVVVFPIAIGLAAGINQGPLTGLLVGGSAWLLEAAVFRKIRLDSQSRN